MKLQKTYSAKKHVIWILLIENVLHCPQSHEVDKEVYEPQLLSILVNLTNEFCYWHRQIRKFLINCTLTKATVQNFSEENLLEKTPENCQELICAGVQLSQKYSFIGSKFTKNALHQKFC